MTNPNPPLSETPTVVAIGAFVQVGYAWRWCDDPPHRWNLSRVEPQVDPAERVNLKTVRLYVRKEDTLL